jgi:hypothetical protein
MRLACGVTTERGLDWTALSIELSEGSGMMDLAHKFTAMVRGPVLRVLWLLR